MHRDEYARMRLLEDKHWWFVSRRDLLLGAIRRFPPPVPPAGDGRPHDTAPRFLDVGCGTGGTMDRLRHAGVSVMGLDMEPLALHFCRERGHKALVIGSATTLPFPDQSFSAIIAMDVLEHIPDHQTAAREIARVLVPGGLLYATVPAHRSLWSSHDIALMHQRRYSHSEFTHLLRASGLSIVHHSYTVSALLPTVWAVRTIRRKLRPHAPPKADVGPVPAPLNAALRHGLKVENALALRRRIPFGVSLFAVASR